MIRKKPYKEKLYSFRATYAGSRINQKAGFWQRRQSFLFKLLIFLMPVALLAYLFFYSPVFVINKVEVEGFDDTEIIEDLNTLKGQNIFLVRFAQFNHEVLERNPDIDQINIIRGLPDTIKVRGQKRTQSIVWLAGGSQYVLDQNGIIYAAVKEIPPWSESDIPIVEDLREMEISSGQRLIAAQNIIKFKRIKELLVDDTTLDAQALVIENTALQPKLRLENGIYVKLDLMSSLERQIEALKAFYAHQRSANEYIDVRVPNMIYYK